MDKPHHDMHTTDRRSRRRHRRPLRGDAHEPRRAPSILLTDEGFPAATPDGPKPSSAVFVSDESRARFPWLPRRVIAGSVWRGPQHERVKVDETGRAEHWR